MTTCSVKEWNGSLIGTANADMLTAFSTKMFSFGGDLVTKKMVKLGVTVNWSASLTFNILVKFRTSINDGYETWNSIDSDTSFDENGLGHDDGETLAAGGYTFILPYANENNDNDLNDIKTRFNMIQFLFEFNLENNTTGNVSINDISLLIRKLRDYGGE